MIEETLSVFIPGKPEPQGSTKAFNVPSRYSASGWRPIVTSDNARLKCWRGLAVTCIGDSIKPGSCLPVFEKTYAVAVHAEFVFPRLKGHPKSRTPSMLVAPDLDKLARALGDVLTVASVVHDDSQISEWTVRKRYAVPGEAAGTHVEVRYARQANPGSLGSLELSGLFGEVSA